MLSINALTYSYGNTVVLSNLCLDIKLNTIYCIVGPSGCGKTTLLKNISGILPPKLGSVIWDAGDKFSLMMQEDTLLPWRTVKGNIRLGTELTTRDQLSESDINSYLLNFELQNTIDLYPAELSGGMKQRISLIQSLVSHPNYLFLDEPFSNLDFDIKLKVQQQLLSIHNTTSNTMVIVTHDIEDAIALSDYVVILSKQPTFVKKIIPIELGFKDKDPIKARVSPKMSYYFDLIWDELKYE